MTYQMGDLDKQAEAKLLANLQLDVLEKKPRAEEMLATFVATQAAIGHSSTEDDWIEWSMFKNALEMERLGLPHNDGSARWANYYRTGVWVRGY
jgi:hypothetical protein